MIASPKVPECRVLVPRGIFSTLRLHSEHPVLVTTSGGEGTFVALLPATHEEAVIVMAPTESARLPLEPDAEPCCVIHRPLEPRPCAEAQLPLDQPPAPASHNESVPRGSHAPSRWTDATDFDTLVPRLIEAATHETRVVLDAPRGMLIGGSRSGRSHCRP